MQQHRRRAVGTEKGVLEVSAAGQPVPNIEGPPRYRERGAEWKALGSPRAARVEYARLRRRRIQRFRSIA